ncbi:SDR family NAD(P)-dependent oxidoreductase [Fertoebacter nigrum]|uniref:SDR family NAD(P)-dependent oxidoreductase n=1 Tax=Fertoeibacter niger TaxID=2656921 RepID=A0A8X8H8I7_9RHOB|nr:SDR family NAD(P)-dependent oxidoreductase [Fertoeibacter niger]
MEIAGSVALVTGAGSGLGAATARHLSGLGARVAVLDFDLPRASHVAQEIGGLAVQADVADEPAVAAAFAQVAAAFGAPRFVVNCAGIGTAARILGREGKLSVAAFARTLQVNLLGTYTVMSHAARAMEGLAPLGPDGARGVIVNTASVAWQDGQIGQAAYAASKGGVVSMTLPAARELARFGIRVATIAPGMFETAMTDGLPPDVLATITANIPFPPRLGQAGEYAMLVEQIIRNPLLNGTTIRLDGAVRLPPR